MEKIKNKIMDYGHLVMFSHSIFSFPFAVMAMLWGNNGIPSLWTLFWIFICLLGARNGANAYNRVADYKFDKLNQRTANREIPSGKVSLKEATMLSIVAFVLLVVGALMLNWICVVLLPVAIFLLVFYSYSKRYTWLCHYILGICSAAAPVGAWLAVKGGLSLTPIAMAIGVTFWVAGFDIIYATQDINFDRKNNLKSIPARFGKEKALLISSISHCIAAICLFSVYFFENRSIVYLIGMIIISILMIIEHRNVNPKNRKKIEFKAYSINQIISITYLVFGLIDFFIV